MLQSSIAKYLDYKEKTGFNMKQKLLFFRELAYLLGGGVGINEAMNVISRDGDTAAQRYVGKSISIHINEGKSLTNALAKLPDYFSVSDVSIVKAGESSGNLVKVLRSLAQEYSFLYILKNKFISAITYPAVLFVIAIIAVFILFIGILPGIFSIATQFPGVELPAITRFMMSMSAWMQHNIPTIIIAVGLLLFLGSIVLSSESGRTALFRLALSLPGIGILIRNYYLVKMMRYMKLLQQSGMNYVESLTLLYDIMGIEIYQQMIHGMLARVQRGEPMYTGTIGYLYLIPANATTLLKVGEETAQLPETLGNIVDIYEEDLLASIDGLSKIIEPVLIVFLGVVIALIALSVFGIITTILGGVQAG